jgi:hypothetical protein
MTIRRNSLLVENQESMSLEQWFQARGAEYLQAFREDLDYLIFSASNITITNSVLATAHSLRIQFQPTGADNEVHTLVCTVQEQLSIDCALDGQLLCSCPDMNEDYFPYSVYQEYNLPYDEMAMDTLIMAIEEIVGSLVDTDFATEYP